MDFGKYVRRVRSELRQQDAEFTVKAVAERVGIIPNYLSRIERGQVSPPSEEKILNLATDLSIDPEYLLALAGRVSSQRQADIATEIVRRHADGGAEVSTRGPGTLNLFDGWGPDGWGQAEDRLSHVLAWILERDQDGMQKLLEHGGRSKRVASNFRVCQQVVASRKSGRPDLVVESKRGRTLGVIEVKISTHQEPTKHQKRGYVKFLAKRGGKGPEKVFIVPRGYAHKSPPGFAILFIQDLIRADWFEPQHRLLLNEAWMSVSGFALDPDAVDVEVPWTNENWRFLKEFRRQFSDHSVLGSLGLHLPGPRTDRNATYYGSDLSWRGNRIAWIGFSDDAPADVCGFCLEPTVETTSLDADDANVISNDEDDLYWIPRQEVSRRGVLTVRDCLDALVPIILSLAR